jgi:hypothetical protein
MNLTSLTKMFRRPKKGPADIPEFEPRLNERVDPEWRQRLRDWLNMPEAKLAFSILESTRPTYFVGIRVNCDPQVNEQLAMQRLYQLQGWQAFRNRLLTLDRTPEEIKQLEESYSSEPNI